MAYRRYQSNSYRHHDEDPYTEDDHHYHNEGYVTSHLDRGRSDYYRDQRIVRFVDDQHLGHHEQEDSYDVHRQNRYGAQQPYDEPDSAAYRVADRSTSRKSYPHYDEYSVHHKHFDERAHSSKWRNDDSRLEQTSDHLNEYNEHEEYTASGYTERQREHYVSDPYRECYDVPDSEYDNHSGYTWRKSRNAKYSDDYRSETRMDGHKRYVSCTDNSAGTDYQSFSHRRDRHHYGEGHSASRHSRVNTHERFPHRARGSKNHRGRQHKDPYSENKDRRREPLVKEAPLSDEMPSVRAEQRTEDILTSPEHKTFDKNRDVNWKREEFSGSVKDKRERRKTVRLLSTPSESPEDICTNLSADYGTNVPSHGLLPTPTYPGIGSPHETFYSKDEDKHVISKGLPSTHLDPEMDNFQEQACTETLNIDINSNGLLPTPTEIEIDYSLDTNYTDASSENINSNDPPEAAVEIDDSVETNYMHQTPIDNEESLIYPSNGLYHTHTASQDHSVYSTDLFSNQPWSAGINSKHSYTSTMSPSAFSPLNECVLVKTVQADREVDTIIYPSRGLLPTPHDSPTLSNLITENVPNTETAVKNEKDSSSSKTKKERKHDKMESIENDRPMSNGRSTVPQDNRYTKEETAVSSNDNLNTENTTRDDRRKQSVKVSGKQEQVTEKQILENIKVQIQLAKALESMQKTMNSLQKKIHEDHMVPDVQKEQGKVKKELVSTRKEERHEKVSPDMECKERNDTVDNATDTPDSSPSSHSVTKADMPCSTLVGGDGHLTEEVVMVENDQNQQESELDVKDCTDIEAQNVSAEDCVEIKNRPSESVSHLNKNQTNRPTGKREYKTYKEWRLAKERMDKYFNEMSSESKNKSKRYGDNIETGSVKDKNKTGKCEQNTNTSYQNSVNHNAGISSASNNNLEHKSEEQKGVIDKKNKEVSDFPVRTSSNKKESRNAFESVTFDYNFGETDAALNKPLSDDKPQQKTDHMSVTERHLEVEVESKQEHINKQNSNHSETHEKTDMEKSSYNGKYKGSFSEKSHSHKEHKSESTSKDEVREKASYNKGHSERRASHEHSCRHRKSDDKRNLEHDRNIKDRERHRSSKSHSKGHHSKDKSKYRSDRSERSGKHRSSSTEKSHRHHHQRSHHSSREGKHGSRSKTDIDESANKHLIVGKEKEGTLPLELESHITCESQDKSGQDYFKQELKSVKMGTFSETTILNEGMTDIVGGISTNMEKSESENGVNSRARDTERNLKSVFVKLYDINKNTDNKNKDLPEGNRQKVRQNTVSTNEPKRTENIFEKMGQNITPLKINKSRTGLRKSNSDTNSDKAQVTSAGSTHKPSVTESEDSSTDIDPFEKMSSFLYKNKSHKSKSSSVELNNFVVSDDHVSDTDSTNKIKTGGVMPKKVSDCSEKKGFESVKHLKRLNNFLYWRNTKLIFPRVNLQRLKHKDIKRLKARLKERKTQSDTGQTNGESSHSGRKSAKDQKPGYETETSIGARLNKSDSGTDEQKEHKRNMNEDKNPIQSTKSRFEEFSLPVNREVLPKNISFTEKTAENTQVNIEISSKFEKSNTLKDGKVNSKDVNESKPLDSTKTKTLPYAKENKEKCNQGFDEQNSKKYKRIVSFKCSSTEQSESSDIERVVCVSQREKVGPVISDSDESLNLEGSLGSEDSTGFDESEFEQSSQTNNEEQKEPTHALKKQSCLESDMGHHSDTHESEPYPSAETPATEKKNKTGELNKNEDSSSTLHCSQEAGNHSSMVDIRHLKTRRNIFTDVTTESTAGEGVGGSSNSSLSNKSTIVGASFAKFKATLGKTLKRLNVDDLQTQSSEDSVGPDFVCLPGRRASLQKANLKDSTQSESNLSGNCSVSMHGIEKYEGQGHLPPLDKDQLGTSSSGQEFLSLSDRRASLQKLETKDTTQSEGNLSDNCFLKTHEIKTNGGQGRLFTHDRNEDCERNSPVEKKYYPMTCSESAGKNIKRRKFDDSSSESSDEEKKVSERKSESKYRKMHSAKGNEENKVCKQDTKGENKESPKSCYTKNCGHRTKIMQMDGNADLVVLGPPDDSSGDEGDVEDNISCVYADSEDENSASQDLFDNTRLKHMSQNFKRVLGRVYSDISVGKETHVEDSKKSGEEEKINSGECCTELDNTKVVIEKGNDLSKNETETSQVKENVIKDEPDWLKYGYTQELDIIFLSDDDEIVMSVSQPPILVSDEETQDPDATLDVVLDSIKQETLGPDEKYATVDTSCENYSSAEDWSDKGSDFEPENLFNSLQRAHDNALAGLSDQNISECSLFSDEDMFKSQSVLETNNGKHKNDGFESSDAAVMSVNEDELLGSPASDEISVSNINEDELLEIREELSSNSDEIILKSALELEDQHEKQTINKIESRSDNKEERESSKKETLDIKTCFEPDPAESSKRKDSLTDKKLKRSAIVGDCHEMTPYQQDTQIDPLLSDGDTSNSITAFDFYSENFAESDAEPNKLDGIKNDDKKHSKSNKYEYETLSDDSDIMILEYPANENEMKEGKESSQTNAEKGENNQKNSLGISDVNEDKYLDKTQIELKQSEVKFANKPHISDDRVKGSVLNSMYLLDTQLENPEPNSSYSHRNGHNSLDNLVHSKSSDNQSQTKMNFTESAFFEDQTQKDNSHQSVFSEQTQRDHQESTVFHEQTQVDYSIPKVYSDQTQVDRPGSSNVLLENNESLEYMSDSSDIDEDPQLQSYFHKSPLNEQTMKDKRFCRNLGIIIDSFINNQDKMDNEYDFLTQIDATENSDKIKPRGNNRGKLLVNKRDGIVKQDKSVYNVLTEVVSSEESEDYADYEASTQIDQRTKDRSHEKTNSEEQIKIVANDSIYYDATQFEYISETESELVSENNNAYDISTQVCKKKSVSENVFRKRGPYKKLSIDIKADLVESERDIYDISDSTDNDSKKDKLSNSQMKNSAYQAATQHDFDDVSESEKDDIELYNISTQKDLNDSSHVDLVEDISNDEDDLFKEDNRGNLVGVKDIDDISTSGDNSSNGYLAATQRKFNEENGDNNELNAYEAATQRNFDNMSESEENENEDWYGVATQVDTGRDIDEENNFVDHIFGDSIRESDKNKTLGDMDDENAILLDTTNEDLPDIVSINTSTETEDLYMAATQVDTGSILKANRTPVPISDRESELVNNKDKPVLGAKSILKRPFPGTSSDKTVHFGSVSEHGAIKKPRLCERKSLEIEPQKLKTTAEKRASGVITGPPKPLKSVNIASSQSDIQMLDMPRGSSWLSKTIGMKKIPNKGKDPDKKRKRKEKNDEDLRAKMIAARSQVRERFMHNITHPDTTKRMKTGQTATVTPGEVEDVALPTDSQIIKQGLPVLNTTGVILKPQSSDTYRNKDHPAEGVDNTGTGTMSDLANRHVAITTVASATTTISTAVSSSVPNSVSSATVNVTAKIQHSSAVLEMNENQNHREENKISAKYSSASKSGKTSDRQEKGDDKGERDRDKKSNDKRSKERKGESKSNDGRNKEKYQRRDNNESMSKTKEHRDRNAKQENKDHPEKSSEDRKHSKDKHGKKREEEKSSGSKDRRERYDSGQKRDRHRHSSSSSRQPGNKHNDRSSQKRTDERRSSAKDSRENIIQKVSDKENEMTIHSRTDESKNSAKDSRENTKQKVSDKENQVKIHFRTDESKNSAKDSRENTKQKVIDKENQVKIHFRTDESKNSAKDSRENTKQKVSDKENQVKIHFRTDESKNSAKDSRENTKHKVSDKENPLKIHFRTDESKNSAKDSRENTKHKVSDKEIQVKKKVSDKENLVKIHSRTDENRNSVKDVRENIKHKVCERENKAEIHSRTGSVPVSKPSSTSVTSTVTCLPIVTTASAKSSGVLGISVTSSNTVQSALKLTSSVTMVTTTTTTSVSRNTMKTVPGIRNTAATHIQSSVLLQKQPIRPSTSGTTSTSGRQPFQPLVPNIPVELVPANMVENRPRMQWNDFLKVILKWSPNWFEERAKMEQTSRRAPPPDVTNDLLGSNDHQLYPLLERYENFKEYSEKFMLPLLLHETWESCYSTWREKKNKNRLCKHKLMFSHQAQGGDKILLYTLIGLISKRDRQMNNCVSEGDLVKMAINGDMKISDNSRKNMNYTMSGFVDKVVFKDFSIDRICSHYKEMAEIRNKLGECMSLKLVVKVRFRSFIPNDKAVVDLESVSTIINTWRQFTAISWLPKGPLCRDLLYPTGNMTYCDRAPAVVNGLQDKYNRSQLTAISTAAKISSLPVETARVCLLQGPPGTGKSHTIVGMIKYLVKVHGGRCRICLCAPSHAAVDELSRRLIKYNRTVDKYSGIKLVRLGKKSSIHPDIQSFCLDNLVQKNIEQAQKDELLKQLPQSLQGERKSLENKITMVTKNIATAKDQYQQRKLRLDLKKLEKQKEVLESKYILPKANFDPQQERKAKSNLLQRAHVIAGTLSSIGSNVLRTEFQNMKGPAFQVVIIDEATQAIELETLIPLQYGVTKLILVGDPEQLPATVLSQVATDNKFNMSLFERLDSHFRYRKDNPVILLDTQYRMDPEISEFPNKYIYDGRIQDDSCVIERNQLPLVPYLLFDVTEGRELFSQGTRSMSNLLEAIFTAELCKFIVTETSVIERVIGIIAPYANQKAEILKELNKRNLRGIEVSTVDGFQGREKHVIVMSCVRANFLGTVGFVGNRNRMNVSLTRAKYAMYLVGHFQALESSDEWKALIADARERGKVEPVNQSSMKRAIRKTLKQHN